MTNSLTVTDLIEAVYERSRKWRNCGNPAKAAIVVVYKQNKTSQVKICIKKVSCELVMSFQRSVSPRQLELLLDFLAQHRGLATARSVRGKEGSALSKRLWSKCASILNKEPGGTRKSALDWKKYFNTYKSRTKSKVRAAESLKENGEDPTEPCLLTPLEERLCRIIGGFNSPKRLNPLDNDIIPNVMVDQEDDDFDMSTTPSRATSQTNEIDHKEHVEAHSLHIKREKISLDNHNDHGNDHTEVRTSTAQRRSRNPRYNSSDRDELRGVEERLVSLEQSRIEVERDMVGAINRQAAATESFVFQVKRFVDLFEMKVKRRRSSESE